MDAFTPDILAFLKQNIIQKLYEEAACGWQKFMVTRTLAAMVFLPLGAR